MFLKKAEGSWFRNYKEFSLEFTSPISIFTGDNGQGKSSFLEALYCGLRGKSFYPFVNSQIIQHTQKRAKVCLNLEENGGLSTVESYFFLSGERLKKEIFYCGKKTRVSYLEQKFPAFVFIEDDMKCIRGGADQRRTFVDEMLNFGYSKQIKDNFNQILKQKRKLLKDFKQGFLSFKETDTMLQAVNVKFLDCSLQLVKERLRILKKIFSPLDNLKQEFFTPPLPQLRFSYTIFEDRKAREVDQNVDIHSLLDKDIKNKHKEELQTGLVLSGPQKHEIQFLFNGKDSRVFCSKGEQRTFILSLLGSHICQVSKAFLFLDDVLMELDTKVQDKFLQFLEKNHCQTFLTNCNLMSLKTEKTSVFSVENATIHKI